MKALAIPVEDLVVSDELRRSGSAKQFRDRLRASIEQIGLIEPLKVARAENQGKYLVIDGTLRLEAILDIRRDSPSKFGTVPAYLLDYDRRFEIRFQTDIYQDLLPSQLASLVEHLHQNESVSKSEIARYIGVSPATLRNYTGLWRLLQRGGLFARVVDLMDLGVLPSSNPYAWLRLTNAGLRHALERLAGESESAEGWLDRMALAARKGQPTRLTAGQIQSATDNLPDDCYRTDADFRKLKKSLGSRRADTLPPSAELHAARQHLRQVRTRTSDPLLRLAAEAMTAYLG